MLAALHHAARWSDHRAGLRPQSGASTTPGAAQRLLRRFHSARVSVATTSATNLRRSTGAILQPGPQCRKPGCGQQPRQATHDDQSTDLAASRAGLQRWEPPPSRTTRSPRSTGSTPVSSRPRHAPTAGGPPPEPLASAPPPNRPPCLRSTKRAAAVRQGGARFCAGDRSLRGRHCDAAHRGAACASASTPDSRCAAAGHRRGLASSRAGSVVLNVSSSSMLAELLRARPNRNVMVEIPWFVAAEPANTGVLSELARARQLAAAERAPARELPREVLPCFKWALIDLRRRPPPGRAAHRRTARHARSRTSRAAWRTMAQLQRAASSAAPSR